MHQATLQDSANRKWGVDPEAAARLSAG